MLVFENSKNRVSETCDNRGTVTAGITLGVDLKFVNRDERIIIEREIKNTIFRNSILYYGYFCGGDKNNRVDELEGKEDEKEKNY